MVLMRNNNETGFTLIELMITVVIFAVIAAVAMPSFRQMILNNQSQALGEELMTALQLARSEAIKRAKYVTLCASKDGTSCTSDWGDGAIVVVDDASSSTATSPVITTPATDVLRYFKWSSNKAVISGPAFLRYQSLGTLAQVGGNTSFTFTPAVTGCDGKSALDITIGVAGMIDSKRVDCP